MNYPLLVNMLTGGVTPIRSIRELEKLGYKIAVCPIASLLITAAGVQRVVNTLLDEGRVDTLANEMLTFDQIKQLLGLDEVTALRTKLEKQ